MILPENCHWKREYCWDYSNGGHLPGQDKCAPILTTKTRVRGFVKKHSLNIDVYCKLQRPTD